MNDEGDVPAKKKPRLTLEEKMNQLNCYKNLKPDPNSAPAHVIRSLTKPDVTSKRQAVLKKIELQKLQARMNAKKRQKKPQLAATIDDTKSEFKEKKLNIILDAKFNKNLWTSKLRGIFLFFFVTWVKNFDLVKGSDLPELTHTNEYHLRSTKQVPAVVSSLQPGG